MGDAAPTISVVLATYNRLAYLPAAVDSIIGQTFTDWELLIVDDGSAAPIKKYLAGLESEPRIRTRRLSHSGRPAVVRNVALRAARGRWVAFMDSDDVWLPDKLNRQLASLEVHPKCLWSHTSFLLMDAQGSPLRRMPAQGGDIRAALLEARTVIALPSVLVQRALLDRVAGFDETLTQCEDYDLWLRLAAQSPVDALDECLTHVRRHAAHYGDAATSYRDVLRVLQKALKAGVSARIRKRVRKTQLKYAVLLLRQRLSTLLRRLT